MFTYLMAFFRVYGNTILTFVVFHDKLVLTSVNQHSELLKEDLVQGPPGFTKMAILLFYYTILKNSETDFLGS